MTGRRGRRKTPKLGSCDRGEAMENGNKESRSCDRERLPRRGGKENTEETAVKIRG